MSLKTRILLSIAWFVLCIAIGLGAIVFVARGGGSSRDRNERASMVGAGLGTVVGIGWAGLWIPWAAAIGKQRRAERERARRKKKQR